MSDEQPKISLDWVQLAAGALTAVTSAVLLSTVGVAGTLIGAAVGSVLGTVGNAVYSHYLKVSRRRVAAAKALAEERTREASARAARVRVQAAVGGDQAEHRLRNAEDQLQQARADLEDAGQRSRVSWREALAGLPWRRVLAVACAVFVIAFGAILAFEVVTGRALSTYTGGTDTPTRTSVPGFGQDRSGDREPDDDGPEQDDGERPAPTPTDATDPTPTPTLPSPPDDEPSSPEPPAETPAPPEAPAPTAPPTG